MALIICSDRDGAASGRIAETGSPGQRARGRPRKAVRCPECGIRLDTDQHRHRVRAGTLCLKCRLVADV